MNIIKGFTTANGLSERVFNSLQSAFALFVRFYVSWQFLKSGWLKLNSWETTLYLFRDEYRVPLLPSDIAAVVGTTGEILFPVLLIAGLLTRFSAVGLSAVNAMAVISYAHVLFSEGFEAAVGQHFLWGFMLLVTVIYGSGKLSLDYALTRTIDRRAAQAESVAGAI